MMTLQLTFRLASPSDFEEILHLSEGIYDGHDYLPFRYHTWMKMKNVAVMLAYSGEKLVGLGVCSVFDEGKTAIRRAARTLAEFRGQGVYTQTVQAMNDFIRRQYPSVCRERFTTMRMLPSVMTRLKLDNLISYAKHESLHSHHFFTVDTSIQIEACTKNYLCEVIFSKPQAQKLFPHDAIILEYFPFEPKRSNIDFLQQECDMYFAVEKCVDGALPRSVSFGLLSPRVTIVYWSVTVYTSDPVLYEAHLLYQFKRACELIDGDFCFHCLQDQSLTKYGRRVLEEKLPVELDEEESKMPLNLYENKLTQ